MHRPCYTFFCIRNVVIKTTFNFKFRVYDVILEKQLGGIEIQMTKIELETQQHGETKSYCIQIEISYTNISVFPIRERLL